MCTWKRIKDCPIYIYGNEWMYIVYLEGVVGPSVVEVVAEAGDHLKRESYQSRSDWSERSENLTSALRINLLKREEDDQTSSSTFFSFSSLSSSPIPRHRPRAPRRDDTSLEEVEVDRHLHCHWCPCHCPHSHPPHHHLSSSSIIDHRPQWGFLVLIILVDSYESKGLQLGDDTSLVELGHDLFVIVVLVIVSASSSWSLSLSLSIVVVDNLSSSTHQSKGLQLGDDTSLDEVEVGEQEEGKVSHLFWPIKNTFLTNNLQWMGWPTE